MRFSKLALSILSVFNGLRLHVELLRLLSLLDDKLGQTKMALRMAWKGQEGVESSVFRALRHEYLLITVPPISNFKPSGLDNLRGPTLHCSLCVLSG